MTPLFLSALAVLLAGPVPGRLVRFSSLRRVPHAVMVLWQSIAAAAVLSAVGAGVALAAGTGTQPRHSPGMYAVALVAVLTTVGVVGRLLLSGHRVGTRLRAARRRHRALVDLVTAERAGVRVLEADTPVAYCVPGLGHSRVVVSAGALGALAPEELAAVLAHERAHLRARHDLVLEGFTVLREAFPRVGSGGAVLAEVRLLVELLADRAAMRRHGRVSLARALVTIAEGRAPDVALGAAGSMVATRVRALMEDRPHRLLAGAVYLGAVAVLALPVAVVVLL